MRRRIFTVILALLLTMSLEGAAEMKNEIKREDIKEVSVHDPSVVKDKDGKYYVFGSHITTAVSSDLTNWNYVARGYKREGNVHFGNLSENLKGSFQWAGEDDGDCVGGFAVWAPDVYYNENYVWSDRTKGAYMMYYSASSTYKRSCIGLAVSKDINGPYEYVDTLIYSGFTKNDSKDENSTHNNKYTNTHLDELFEKGKVCGYKDDWGIDDYNNITYPNAIDPCIYTDKEGRLYLAYGSWSGGIFVLPVNEQTGLLVYPGFDSATEDGRMIDRYFGVHIAGGRGLSGEGAYVYYDEESGFYYLQDTYDWLGTDGGYHIRMFRSENPTGPFVDITGNGAIYGEDMSKSGVKMFGNYYLNDLEKPYTSGGHCSTLIDGNNRYIFYHTRFKNSEAFQLRVHQMFLNEDGWAVIVPYRYMGDEISTDGYSDDEIAGLYEFINHGNKVGVGSSVNTSLSVTLSKDGRITGAIEGTWSKSGKYCTITTNEGEYKGVFFKQKNELGEHVMTFSAVGGENCAIWGVKCKEESAPENFMSFDFEDGQGEVKLVRCAKNENPKVDEGIAPVFEEGISGKAVRLDSTFGMEISGVDLSRDFTLSFWMKPDKISTYTPIVSASADFHNAGFDKWFSLTTFDNGKDAVIWSRNAEYNQWMEAKGKDIYSMGDWQHVAIVFDRNYYGGNTDVIYARLYINGHNVLTGDVSKGALSPQSRLFFCINPWDEPFEGLIDEVQIFDTALSHSEVSELYTS